mgnify:CR=1 FL=1
MNTLEIKQELKRLIESESNPDILSSLYEILNKSAGQAEVLREKLISRARQANEDIANNRIMNREGIERRTDDLL